jgi:hypothetical protein
MWSSGFPCFSFSFNLKLTFLILASDFIKFKVEKYGCRSMNNNLCKKIKIQFVRLEQNFFFFSERRSHLNMPGTNPRANLEKKRTNLQVRKSIFEIYRFENRFLKSMGSNIDFWNLWVRKSFTHFLIQESFPIFFSGSWS